MLDLRKIIAPKSDQLNADDLLSGQIVIKITDVKITSGDQPLSIYYEGCNNRPWKPCKTMARALVHLWGHDGKQFIGRSVQLKHDPSVRWGGEEVGGIRIAGLSHIKRTRIVPTTISKGKKAPLKIELIEEAAGVAPSGQTLEAGTEAASKGVAAYTEWKNALPPEIKATIAGHHAGFVRLAKKADESKEPEQEGFDEIPM